MITVTAKVMGKSATLLEDFEGTTIADVLSALELEGNYTFNLGGKPATAESLLSDGSYIVFAPSVKGAMAKKATKRATSTNLNKAPLKVKAVKKVAKKK